MKNFVNAGTRHIKSLLYLIPCLSVFFFVKCTYRKPQSGSEKELVGTYRVDYTAGSRTLTINVIDVSPPSAGQNTAGKAGIFETGSAVFSGSTITQPIYLTNNDTQSWTGVEVQTVKIISGNQNTTACNTDLGTGWSAQTPAYGAWGWIFTSDTAGSTYTLSSGASSAAKALCFNSPSDFSAWIYVYADVPIVASLSTDNAFTMTSVNDPVYDTFTTTTIYGYNFSTTPGTVTLGGVTMPVIAWTASYITVAVPQTGSRGNIIVNAGGLYSNPELFTPLFHYTIYTNSIMPSQPFGIAVDSSGNAWVVDPGNYVFAELNSAGGLVGGNGEIPSCFGGYVTLWTPAIDASGNAWIIGNSSAMAACGSLAAVYNTSDTLIDEYSVARGTYPLYGIALDAPGDAWIGDTYTDNAVELSPTGTTIGMYPVGNSPMGITIDGSGNAWIVNNGDNSIMVLSSSGTLITTCTTGLNSPVVAAIDSSGNAWVANQGSNTVVKLSPSCSLLNTFNVGTAPQGLAIDASGNVWVTNSGSDTVTVLNPSGTAIATYNTEPRPYGIAIDASGNVWIACNGSDGVTVIRNAATGPQYFPYSGPQFPGGSNF